MRLIFIQNYIFQSLNKSKQGNYIYPALKTFCSSRIMVKHLLFDNLPFCRVEQVEEQSVQDSEPGEDLIADESAITESKVALQPIYVPNRVPDLVPNEGEENVQAKENQNDDILIDTTVGLDVIENQETNDEIQTPKLNRQQFLPSFIQSTVSGLSVETDSGIEGQYENDLNQEDIIAIAKELVAEIFEENPTDEVMEHGFHVNPFMDCRLRSDENPCNPLMVNPAPTGFITTMQKFNLRESF